MAALLTSESEENNKRNIMVEHIDDARRLGVPVLPPCVNKSESLFSVQNGEIVFGLTAIKGFGRSSAEEVVRAREEGEPFTDIFDFCARVDLRIVKAAAIEKLIMAGAFDNLSGHRAQLLQVLPRAIDSAQEKQEDLRLGQGNLFDMLGGEQEQKVVQDSLPDVPKWSEKEMLKHEKEVLDFYFSSHPLAEHATDLMRYSTHTIEQISTVEPGKEITIGGMLTRVQFRTSQRARNGNNRFLRCYVEDMNGEAECVMWGDALSRHEIEKIHDDKICFVRATLDAHSTRQGKGLILSEIIDVEEMHKQACNEVWILMKLGVHKPLAIDTLANVLQRTPGSGQVWLTILDEAGKKTHLKLGNSFRVNAMELNVSELETMLGPGTVKLVRSASGR